MIDFLVEWLIAVAVILCESGPYLLLGFIIAGYLKVLVPEKRIYRYLGKDDFRSVATASLVGAPIPLCSCSVLPTAVALKKNGASKGATTSFLISTPETGVDSIGITWALMDPLMTIVRPLAAIATALGAGSAVNKLVRSGWDRPPPTAATVSDACGDDHDHEAIAKDVAIGKTRRAFAYAFGPLLDDLTPWFVLGFIVSGFIMVLVPADFFGSVLPTGWISMVAMLFIGIPIYICATASTPVAAALIAKGLDPGSALVLLLAGPATNLATMVIVNGFLGRRVLVVYLICIAAFALLMGLLVNVLYDLLALAPVTSITVPEEAFGAVSVIGGLVLGALLIRSAARIRLLRDSGEWLQRRCHPLGFDPLSRFSRIAILVLVSCLYLSTGITVLGKGESGFVVRFGKVHRTLDQPGLYFHALFPMDRVERTQTERVRGVDLGFRRLGKPGAERVRDFLAEQAMISGEENIIAMSYSVHYRITDPYRFRYGIEDPTTLVGALAESSIRQLVAQHESDRILVGNRTVLEAEARMILQRELDKLEADLEVVAVNLLDIHAPREVHFAYRDVASALEDKERQIRQGEGFAQERMAAARAEAYRIEQEALNDKTRLLQNALGDAMAFQNMVAAYAGHPEVTRVRLRSKSTELALAGTRLIVLLDPRVKVRLLQNTPNEIVIPQPTPSVSPTNPLMLEDEQ